MVAGSTFANASLAAPAVAFGAIPDAGQIAAVRGLQPFVVISARGRPSADTRGRLRHLAAAPCPTGLNGCRRFFPRGDRLGLGRRSLAAQPQLQVALLRRWGKADEVSRLGVQRSCQFLGCCPILRVVISNMRLADREWRRCLLGRPSCFRKLRHGLISTFGRKTLGDIDGQAHVCLFRIRQQLLRAGIRRRHRGTGKLQP